MGSGGLRRVLVVDDEALARGLLRRYVDAHSELEWCGEAASGIEAIDRLVDIEPDILLLDVEMPELDGFGALAELERRRIALPQIVFVTAYERYAVRAFEIHAVDYLLKPVTEARFRTAIERCCEREPSASARGLLEDVLVLPPTRFLVREHGRIRPVPLEEIEWIEASDDYVTLHTEQASHLVEKSLTDVAQMLARRGFARVHRGAVVNLARIQEIRPLGGGRHELLLSNGRTVNVSRSYAKLFRAGVL